MALAFDFGPGPASAECVKPVRPLRTPKPLLLLGVGSLQFGTKGTSSFSQPPASESRAKRSEERASGKWLTEHARRVEA